MYGFARVRPGLKIDDQVAAIKAFAGNDRIRIFEARKGSDHTLDDLLRVLRPDNVLVVFRLVTLVPPKSELNRTAPRSFLDKVINTLVEKRVQVIEADTGMDLNKSDDAQRAVSRAYNDLSGYKRQKAGPGRPAAPPLEETERLRLYGLWKSNDYDTNAAAIAAMGDGWSVSKAIKTFGPSGRDAGRRKKSE